LFVAGEPPDLVGWGGFNGAPKDGAVESATRSPSAPRARARERRRRAMVREAFADDCVSAVIAHPLVERNIQTACSRRSASGSTPKPEADATVWRFPPTRPPAASER